MDRRQFLESAGAALAGLSLIGASRGADGKPNLLVIMTDDQPYYTIPYMKAVASHIRDQGMTFSPNAYVSIPICGPARATLLTGKWSHNTHLTSTTNPYAYHQLHTSEYESDTIATRLKKAGYATFFGGKYQNGYDGKAKPPGWDSLVRDGGADQQEGLLPLPNRQPDQEVRPLSAQRDARLE